MKNPLLALLGWVFVAISMSTAAVAKPSATKRKAAAPVSASKSAAAAPRTKSLVAKAGQGRVLPVKAKQAGAQRGQVAAGKLAPGKAARLTAAQGRSLRGGKAHRLVAVSMRAAPVAPVVIEPPKLSYGQMQGLHASGDPLDLKSSVALVVDQDTNEVLLAKNPSAVLPIASLTKLMTAVVVNEARQPMDELLTIAQDDVDTEKGSRSRLAVGTQLSRGDMLHLALMSSENRAANALGRYYPGGLGAFVAAMNRRAAALGMRDTHYVEPTGLSSANQSSARDLTLLVREAYRQPLLRELSTSLEAEVPVGSRMLQFRNTNGLVRSPNWEIGLQKTGYITEAGRCLVMQAHLAGRKLIMVLLDSSGKYSRLGDAERIRRWLGDASAEASPVSRHLPG